MPQKSGTIWQVIEELIRTQFHRSYTEVVYRRMGEWSFGEEEDGTRQLAAEEREIADDRLVCE